MPGLRNSLQIRQTQSQTLAMTPQLQQAIKLLQLSTLELRAEIALNLEHNPLLEVSDEGALANLESLDALIEAERESGEVYDVFDNDNLGSNSADISLSNEVYVSDADDNQAHDKLSSLSEEGKIKESGAQDGAHEGLEHSMSGVKAKARLAGEDSVYEGETSMTLRDHLYWQLELSPLQGDDKIIAEAIIDGVDESGYLTESIDDILAAAALRGVKTDEESVLTVLKIVQHYDPVGVASRSVQECLLAQLNAMDPDASAYLSLAKTTVERYLNLLSNKDFKQLCSKLGINEKQLKAVNDLITSLNPRPGQGVIREKSDFIIPDVICVKQKDGTYTAELNPHALPAIRLNEQYRSLMSRAQTEQDKNFFKSHLQEANWFLVSLNRRNETLLKVASCIVKYQQDFLTKGEKAMHPLILSDVAAEVDLHESTISRITTEKYLHTPRGTFELRYFFSTSVNTDDGKTASTTAIRAIIKELVASEDPRHPYSDSALADKLKEKGILVARRTVAKYRESAGIGSSSQRKRLV